MGHTNHTLYLSHFEMGTVIGSKPVLVLPTLDAFRTLNWRTVAVEIGALGFI